MPELIHELAKEKDKNGFYAMKGMRDFCSKWFDVEKRSTAVFDIINYYLENERLDLFMWFRGGFSPHTPMILKRDNLEKSYSDLLVVSNDLNKIIDLFKYLYDMEFHLDERFDYLYSTEFTYKERKKLNFPAIAKEYGRLITLMEFELLKWEDIDGIIERYYDYGFDIERISQIKTDDLYESGENIISISNKVFDLDKI